MATIEISEAGGTFSATTAWVGGVVPGEHDDIVCMANGKSGSLTHGAAQACRSIDFTNYKKTWTPGAFTFSIGDATAGRENIALKFSSEMVITITASCVLSFVSTSATQQTFTFNGKSLTGNTGKVKFAGVGGSWKLADAFNFSEMILEKGTLDFGGKTGTFGTLTLSGTETKTLNVEGATVKSTKQDNQPISINGTGTTIKAAGSTFTYAPILSESAELRLGSVNWNGTIVIEKGSTGGGALVIGLTGNTITKLDLSKAGNRVVKLVSSKTQTIGELVLGGSAGTQLALEAVTAGTQATLAVTTLVGGDYNSFKDVKIEGVSPAYIGNHSSNRGNTTGWTYTASTGAIGSPYTKQITPDGPLKYWKMGEASGELAENAGGNKIVLSGGPTYKDTGPLKTEDEGAIKFDGVNDAGQVALDLSAVSAITFEALVKWETNSENDDFLVELGPTVNENPGFNVDWNNGSGGVEAGTVSVKWRTSGGAQNRRYTFAQPTAGVWHHVVFVMGLSAALVAYVDGKEVTATGREVTTQTGTFPSATLNVMSRNNASLFGAGDMEHMAIYVGTLSKARVEAHFAAISTESGGKTQETTGSISGTSSFTGSGTRIAATGGSISGLGSFASSGVITRLTKGSISGVGSFSAAGLREASTRGSIAGVGSFAAHGLREVIAKGAIAGLGTLTAAGVRIVSTKGAILGTSTFIASGAGASIKSSTGTIVGTSTFAASGLRIVSTKGSIVGIGIFSATGARVKSTKGSISGIGSLVASGVRIRITTGSISGQGSLTASGRRIVAVRGLITGTSVLTASGIKTAITKGSIIGIGVFTASGDVVALEIPTIVLDYANTDKTISLRDNEQVISLSSVEDVLLNLSEPDAPTEWTESQPVTLDYAITR